MEYGTTGWTGSFLWDKYAFEDCRAKCRTCDVIACVAVRANPSKLFVGRICAEFGTYCALLDLRGRIFFGGDLRFEKGIEGGNVDFHVLWNVENIVEELFVLVEKGHVQW